MNRLQFSPAIVLSTLGALIAIAALTVAGWLAIEGLVDDDADADTDALAAAVAITRHANDLMATGAVASNATMTRDSVLADRSEIARLKSALAEQIAIIEGTDYDATAIAEHVDALVSTVEGIDGGRPDLLRALLLGEQSFQELVVTNTRSLFPAITTSMDNQMYFILTGEGEDRSADMSNTGARSDRELLRLWHLAAVQRDASLGHTVLSIASLLQNPTRVARTQESFETVAQRLAVSLDYLSANPAPELDPQIVPLATSLREAGTGQGSLFEDLAARLELSVREQELIAASEAHHVALLAELDTLAGEVQAGAAAGSDDAADQASAGQTTLLVIAILGAIGMLILGANASRRTT
jgi:hypothetical protein